MDTSGSIDISDTKYLQQYDSIIDGEEKQDRKTAKRKRTNLNLNSNCSKLPIQTSTKTVMQDIGINKNLFKSEKEEVMQELQ